jgi:hypothetical protein
MRQETEHDNSVLEITVSFLGIHEWEPEIYRPFICSVKPAKMPTPSTSLYGTPFLKYRR